MRGRGELFVEFAEFVDHLMLALPYWHYKLDRPFKQAQKENQAAMTLETFYCLQMLRAEGPVTMGELAQRLRLTKQQATRTIDHLYAHGLVRRFQEDGDRRVIRIEITEQAREYLAGHLRQNTLFLKQARRRLTDEELQAFGEAVDTLLHVLPKLD